MLTVTSPSPNRIEIVLDGPFGADEMRAGLENFIEIGSKTENGLMLYRVPEFAMPSFEAVGIKMGQLPRLFGLLKNFRRAALLSDSAFLRTAAEVEGALIPGIDIKAFHLDEEQAAEAWLSGGSDTPKPRPENASS